jgi:NADPH:quinone reductase-like Zn-dependent oxidoreductase
MAVGRGLRVTAVAGGDDEDWVRSLGADEVIPRDADLDSIARSYVLDAVPVGAAVFPAVSDEGRILSTRPIEEKAGRGVEQISVLIELDRERLRELVAEGSLKTRIAETVPLTEVAAAHRHSEEPGHHGKSVLVA